MPKTILLRNVPGALYRHLKARAAEAGMSLSDYSIAALRQSAERLTPTELRERLRSRSAVNLRVSPARAVREERNLQ